MPNNPPMIFNPQADDYRFLFFNPDNTRPMNLNSVTPVTKLFQGYDSITGQALSRTITGPVTKIHPTEPSRARISVCTSTEELAKTLNVEQSLSVSKAGVFSVNAKVSFLNKLSVSTYSTTVVVSAQRQSILESSDEFQCGITPISFPGGASVPREIDLSSRQKLKEFFLAYGDSFVSSITWGGEFYGVYVFDSYSEEEQKQLKIDLAASGIYSGMSAAAEFQSKFDSFRATKKTSSKLEWDVSGLSDLSVITNAGENAVLMVNNFLNAKLDNPRVLTFTTVGYERVKGIGDKFKDIALNRNYFIGSPGVRGEPSKNDGLTKNLVQLYELLNQTRFMMDVLSAYGLPIDNALLKEERIQEDIAKIQDQINRYESDPLVSFEQLNFSTLKEGTPFFQQNLQYGPTWGLGKNDEHVNTIVFDVPNVDSRLITRGQRISLIRLVGAAYVDSITMTYSNISDEAMPVNYTRYGGDGGTDNKTIALPKGTVITSISGRTGDIIDHLRIEASDGAYAEVGGQGGIPFDNWQVPQNYVFIGFIGKTNSRYHENWRPRELQVVGQLQPVCATLLTSWQSIRDSAVPKPPVISTPLPPMPRPIPWRWN